MNRYVATRARQVGLNFGLVSPYIDANLGVYNGRQYFPTGPNGTGFIAANAASPVGNTTLGDQNTGKDIHFGVIGKPPLEGFKIRANIWYGTPLDGFKVKDGENTEKNVSVMFLDGGVDYLAPFGLTFVADVLWGKYTWDKKDPAQNFDADRGNGKAEDYTLGTMSYYAMLGYNFGPAFQVPIEIIARYDWWDPDTLNDKKKHPMSEQDELTDITGGINYYIKNYNAMLSLDYVYHGEAWEKVLTKKGDDDQTGINNDELKLQAQVSF
jgi:hypothetical protein